MAILCLWEQKNIRNSSHYGRFWVCGVLHRCREFLIMEIKNIFPDTAKGIKLKPNLSSIFKYCHEVDFVWFAYHTLIVTIFYPSQNEIKNSQIQKYCHVGFCEFSLAVEYCLKCLIIYLNSCEKNLVIIGIYKVILE